MPGALGDLVIALHADTAAFASDMGRAARISEREWKKVGDHAAAAGRALAAGAALAGAAAIKMGHDFIEAAANLDDMAEKTGASVEELSKLSQQAYISGASLETIEMGLVRLTKALHGGDEEAKGAGKALAALGLQADQLKNKDTAESLRIVAAELNKYQDSAGKTALALDLFGKSGAQLLPILKDMATEGELNVRVTAKQAAEAEELGKSWRRLMNDAKGFGQSIALDLVPWIQKMIDQFSEGIKIAGSFASALRLFGLSNITSSNAGAKIREITAEMEKLTVQRSKFIEQGRSGWTKTIDAQLADLEKQKKFASLLMTQGLGDKDNFDPSFGGTIAKPKIKYDGPQKDVKDFTKQIEDLKRLFEEVQQIGQSIDVTVFPPTFKPENLDKEKRSLGDLKKTLESSRKGWIDMAQAVFDEADATNTAAAAGESFTQTAEKTRERLRDLIDPLRAVAKEHEYIDLLVSQGWMTEMEGRLAKLPAVVRELIQPLTNIHNEIQKAWEAGLLTDDEMQAALLRAQQHVEKTDDFVKSLGLTFESAFEKAISGGMKFSDILKGITADITKLLTRKFVTEPLFAQIGSSIAGGGGGFGSLLGKLGGMFGGAPTGTAAVTESFIADMWSGAYASGTDYVPRTGLALVHQGEAVIPASENARGRSVVINVTTPNADSFRASKRQIMSEFANAF